MNIEILLGKTTEHLVPLEGTKFFVHSLMLKDFLRFQKAAYQDGFDLQIASAFRDYDRQLKIWNSKAKGERVLLDSESKPLEFSTLSPEEIVFSILRWSALPGCSRHHWGSDIDVFDGRTQNLENVQLVPSECIGSGPATALHEWLDEKINSNESFGFFRPYKKDLGGVAPERWHLSYFPVARRMVDHFTFQIFKKNIEDNDIYLKEIVLENALEIYERYFLNFSLP
jgi:LAS superfamily LD-carboxypeptidase LdcB